MEEDDPESPLISGISGNLDETPKVMHGPKAAIRAVEATTTGRRYSSFSESTVSMADDKSKRRGSAWMIQYGNSDIPEEKILADAFAIDHKKWLTETYPKDSSKVYSYELDIPDSYDMKSRSESRDTVPDVESGTESATGMESSTGMASSTGVESATETEQVTGTDYDARTEFAPPILPEAEEIEGSKPAESDVPESKPAGAVESSFVWSFLEYVLTFLVQKYNNLRASRLPGTVSYHADQLGGKDGDDTRQAEGDNGDSSMTEYFSFMAEINQRKYGRPRTGISAPESQVFETINRKFYKRGKSYSQIFKRFQESQRGGLEKKAKQKRKSSRSRGVRRRETRGGSIVSRLVTFLYPTKQKDLSYLSKIRLGFYYAVLLVGISLVVSSFVSCLKDAFIPYLNSYNRDVT